MLDKDLLVVLDGCGPLSALRSMETCRTAPGGKPPRASPAADWASALRWASRSPHPSLVASCAAPWCPPWSTTSATPLASQNSSSWQNTMRRLSFFWDSKTKLWLSVNTFLTLAVGLLKALFSLNDPRSPDAMVDLLVLLCALAGIRDVDAGPRRHRGDLIRAIPCSSSCRVKKITRGEHSGKQEATNACNKQRQTQREIRCKPEADMRQTRATTGQTRTTGLPHRRRTAIRTTTSAGPPRDHHGTTTGPPRPPGRPPGAAEPPGPAGRSHCGSTVHVGRQQVSLAFAWCV